MREFLAWSALVGITGAIVAFGIVVPAVLEALPAR